MSQNLQLKIRMFQLSDIDKVYRIEQKSFTEPWSIIAFKNIHFSNPYGFYVAIKNQEVVGYIIAEISKRFEIMNFRSRRFGHLLNLAIDPDFRRQGIGKTLIKSIFAYLQTENVKEIGLEVRISNTVARKYYISLGFEEKGRKFRYYGSEDAVFMQKKLN